MTLGAERVGGVIGVTGVGWTVSLWIWGNVSLVGMTVSGGTWLSVLYWHASAKHGIPAMAANFTIVLS